jgi:hypothetical protein
MTYKAVFDSTSSTAWWLLGYGPVLAVELLMLVIVGFVTCVGWRGGRRFRFLGRGLFLLLAFQFSWDAWYSHWRYIRWYHHLGAFQAVAGQVRHYRAFSSHDVNFEQFQVEGVPFAYASLGTKKCFHKPVASGGPVREGLFVRASFDGSCVVKLEIRPEERKE